MANTVLIRGVAYSAVNVNNIAFGVPVVGITAINWRKKQDNKHQMGLGQDPEAIIYGQNSYEGSITVYKDWWFSVCNAAPNKDPLQIPPFAWTISYGNPPQTQIQIETLKSVIFLEDGSDIKQGDNSLMLTIPILFVGPVRS